MASRSVMATEEDRPRRRALLAAMAVALATLVPSAGAAEDAREGRPLDRINVVAEATVDGDVVRLGDLARLEGPSAAALAGVEIGRAPAPGATRSFAGATILAILREQVLDLDRVRYRIPTLVRVHRRAQEVSAAALRGIVEEYIRRHAAATDGDILLNVPAPVGLPIGPFTTQVTPMQANSAAGTTRMLVEFLQNQQVVGSATVTAHLAMLEEVWLARRAIA